jgi:hypothetical protein
MSETLTPTGGLPRVGVWFEILSLGYAGVIVVSELLNGHVASMGGGYLALTILSAVLAAIAGLVDIFRPGRIVGWWVVFAVIMAVIVVATPSSGTSEWFVPLFFATGVDATGAHVAVVPILQTFANPPTTFFLSLSGIAFWGLVVAWAMSLRTWRRAPKRRTEGVREAGPFSGGQLG